MTLLLLTVAFAQDTVALPSEMAEPDVVVSPLLSDVQMERIEEEVAALEAEVEKQADNNMAICKALNIECAEVTTEESVSLAPEDTALVTVTP